MGIVKKAFSAFGGLLTKDMAGDSKSPSAPATAAPATNTQTADQIEEERRRRLVSLNQQGPAGQLTSAGGVSGPATVTRKALLGL